MRITRLRRKPIHSTWFEVEPLEERLLCAVGSASIGGDTSQSPTPTDPTTPASSPPGASVTSSSTATAASDATATDTSAGRTDSYGLPASATTPEVRVTIQWADGADPTLGTLFLADATGSIFYQSSLAQVVSLHQVLVVPGTSGDSAVNSVLDLDLTIQRGVAGSTGPGFYLLSLRWDPLAGGAGSMSPPQNLSPSDGASAVPTGPITTTAPPTTTTPTATTTPTSSTPITPATPPGGSQAVAPPGLAVTQSLPIGVPTPLTVGSTTVFGPGSVAGIPPTSGTTHYPVSSGAHNSPAPVGVGSALAGSSVTTDFAGGLVVGPLPLGSSTPDGGIFARSFAEARPFRTSGGITTGTTLTLGSRPISTSGEDGTRAESPIPTHPWAIPLDWVSVPAGHRPPSSSIDDALAATPAVVGAAFLPTVSLATETQPPGPPAAEPSRSPARRRSTARTDRGNPVAASLVVLAASALLILKMGGPDWVRQLRS